MCPISKLCSKFLRLSSTERTRVDLPNPPESRFTTLPRTVPIDWFDPDFWNNDMTLLQKYHVQKNGICVALPAEPLCHPEEWSKWIGKSHKWFMRKHGNAELAKYKLLTAKQMVDMQKIAERRSDNYDSDNDKAGNADYVDIAYDADDDSDNDDSDNDGNNETGQSAKGKGRADDAMEEGEIVEDNGNGGNKGVPAQGKAKVKKRMVATVSRRGIVTTSYTTQEKDAGRESQNGKGKAKVVYVVDVDDDDDDDDLYVKDPSVHSASIDLEAPSEGSENSYMTGDEQLGEDTPRAATFNRDEDDSMEEVDEGSNVGEGSSKEVVSMDVSNV